LLHPKIAAEFAEIFGRKYDLIDEFLLEDADYVFVMTNSFASMGKAEVKRLREQGKRVGLARLRVIRPFPHDDIQRVLRGQECILDQDDIGRANST
jgi:pyruvate ferredoxin oxidoreductase alpha subunit